MIKKTITVAGENYQVEVPDIDEVAEENGITGDGVEKIDLSEATKTPEADNEEVIPGVTMNIEEPPETQDTQKAEPAQDFKEVSQEPQTDMPSFQEILTHLDTPDQAQSGDSSGFMGQAVLAALNDINSELQGIRESLGG